MHFCLCIIFLAKVQFFDLQTIILQSGLIFQQLCRYAHCKNTFDWFSFFNSICLFVSSFVFLLWNWVTPSQFAAVLVAVTLIGFMLWWWAALSQKERNFETCNFF